MENYPIPSGTDLYKHCKSWKSCFKIPLLFVENVMNHVLLENNISLREQTQKLAGNRNRQTGLKVKFCLHQKCQTWWSFHTHEEKTERQQHLSFLKLRYGPKPSTFLEEFLHSSTRTSPSISAALVSLWSAYVLLKAWNTSNRNGHEPSMTLMSSFLFSPCHLIDWIKAINTLKSCSIFCFCFGISASFLPFYIRQNSFLLFFLL